MKKDLDPPKLNGTKIIFNAGYERCMAEREFISPDGSSYIYTMWWFLNKPSSIIFPLTDDRKVVAIREFRHGSADFSLELPGGRANHNETESPEEVAERELLEETGYRTDQLIKLPCDPWVETQSMNLRYYPFLGLACKRVAEPIPEKTVVSETILIPVQEWYAKIFRGEITCNSTLSHSLLVLPHLLKDALPV